MLDSEKEPIINQKLLGGIYVEKGGIDRLISVYYIFDCHYNANDVRVAIINCDVEELNNQFPVISFPIKLVQFTDLFEQKHKLSILILLTVFY